MFTVSDEVKTLLRENYRQLIKIQFPNAGSTIELTEADIVQNTFKWDRYCATGNMLEIGTAVASEVEFTLRNTGVFHTTGGAEVSVDDIIFEGKELTIQIGICKWGARRWENATVTWFDIGKFTIMSMPHKFSTIDISALDRMTRFDVEASRSSFSTTETLHSLIEKICSNIIHISYSLPSTLPNYDLTVDMDKLFEEEQQLTIRTIIQWVAALTGTCAYISVSGVLTFRWLETATGVQLTPHDRYSSTVYEPVMVDGLVVEKNDETMEFGGSDFYYRYEISNNGLIQGEDWLDTYVQEISDLWYKLSATSDPYRPFEASIVPMPYLEPMDIISYKDNDGTVFNTIITHITFSLNGPTEISAVGISETEALCVPSSGRTSRENADIKALKNKMEVLENATAAARERLTDMFRLALGLHMITVTGDTGTIYYFTTASVPDENPTLEDLGEVIKPDDVIYTFSGAGWMWCFGDDWDKDTKQPKGTDEHCWKYGITKDGSAVLGLVNTTGISVSDENTTYQTKITPESFSVYNGSDLVFAFNGQLESQINRLWVKANIPDSTVENNAYIRIGSAMLIPTSGGLDIVYVEDE